MLLALGLMIAGCVAYQFLPVAPLPSVDIPTIVVFANRPGADPATMASSVAAPLERRLGEIAQVTELTSLSATGTTTIIIQFDINRDIDGAAHDVEAAINAAVADLPSELPTAPYYRKFNPADAPIMTLALTSPTRSLAQLYDAADTILGQRLSQVDGVGQVSLNGAEKPAVRVALNPVALQAAGLASQDIVNVIRAANVTQPIGMIGPASILINGQMADAATYAALVIKARNGATVRLGDIARITDSVANTHLAAWNGDQPAILLNITKLAGANVIRTVDGVKATLPQLLRWLPPDINVTITSDRTSTIRASVDGIEATLLITIVLVLLVVLLFLRRLAPTMAALVTVPLSIAGTLTAMWALGYALDNFSLLALTVSVGFVVDDAIVMIENIVRQQERGMPPLQAAIIGARQIGFTVLSITLSLLAVFIPIVFMGGIVGRLMHEFAITLTAAIAVSALVSLTLTPMVCGHFMRVRPVAASGRIMAACLAFYDRTLTTALRWRRSMLLITLASLAMTIVLYRLVPKGFMPLQDTGELIGSTQAAPDISFTAMAERQRAVVAVLRRDPAMANVSSVIGVTNGFNSVNHGQLYAQLKPLSERGLSAEAVIDRLRPALEKIGGIETFLQSAQDLRGGGRSGGSQFQFVLLGNSLEELRHWTERLQTRLRETSGIADVTTDQDRASQQATIEIDRDSAARLGVTVAAIDNALNNAFAQRQISTIYTQRNQYRVVVEAPAGLQADPASLAQIYVPGTNGAAVPLLTVAHLRFGTAPLSIHHQGQFPAVTLSFNLKPGMALGDANAAVERAARELRMPPTIRWEFAGNAKFLTDSLRTQPMLIAAALLTIYIVLGVLYESLIHPLTILSTLPSAGLGALLAILVTGTELSIMSIIGIVLLMGIVKKNGIMLVDFALDAEREAGLSPEQAIRAACLERFRPIIMTTLAAIMGALPLALAFGTGAEYRRPLGITICGGLIVSQMLTLYTTPVIYLSLERLTRGKRRSVRGIPTATEI